MLLTERASQLAKHAAQISFPGGRLEESDPDIASAALREAQEEIGLDPVARARCSAIYRITSSSAAFA